MIENQPFLAVSQDWYVIMRGSTVDTHWDAIGVTLTPGPTLADLKRENSVFIYRAVKVKWYGATSAAIAA